MSHSSYEDTVTVEIIGKGIHLHVAAGPRFFVDTSLFKTRYGELLRGHDTIECVAKYVVSEFEAATEVSGGQVELSRESVAFDVVVLFMALRHYQPPTLGRVCLIDLYEIALLLDI